MLEYSENRYEEMIGKLFVRFPSFQKIGAGAYKPGIENMRTFDAMVGHPHSQYVTIHIAGTNGKGSVSNMLASACAAAGLKTGLFTSPHILDFRERMRIIDGSTDGSGRGFDGGSDGGSGERLNGDGTLRLISREAVWDFVQKWQSEMDRLDLSFFEITTMMAFEWFAQEKVDVAVIETGLGGRLDSTNIITPALSVVTNIGFDHCDMLGHTLAAIAGEKAGIFKSGVPAVVGESDPETDPVFIAKSLEVNQSDDACAGDNQPAGGAGSLCAQPGLLTFADKVEPWLWERKDEILDRMDLQGDYQKKNLRTVLAALEKLRLPGADDGKIIAAIERTAERMDFHGRWEKLSDRPYIIADIGHNSHGLKSNFAQLEKMMQSGGYDRLSIVYATMADKDIDTIARIFPAEAEYYFVTASNKRAMPAEEILKHYLAAGGDPSRARCCTLDEALAAVCAAPDGVSNVAGGNGRSSNILVYIGGSSYLVSEALPKVKTYLK